jgi:uncharacterized protein
MLNSIEQVSRPRVVVGIALSVGIFLVVRVLFPDFAASGATVIATREVVLLALAAALVLYVVVLEQLPISELGWRPRLSSLGWGVAICITLVVASLLTISVARALGFEQDARVLATLARQPAWLLLVVAMTAGIAEEIAFRGVLIDHVGALLRSRHAGAIASVVVFSALHANAWRLTQLFFVLPSAIILTAFYLWKRDLLACILGHALTDTVGLLSAAAAQPN